MPRRHIWRLKRVLVGGENPEDGSYASGVMFLLLWVPGPISPKARRWGFLLQESNRRRPQVALTQVPPWEKCAIDHALAFKPLSLRNALLHTQKHSMPKGLGSQNLVKSQLFTSVHRCSKQSEHNFGLTKKKSLKIKK